MNDAMSQTMVNTTELTKPAIAPNASRPSTTPQPSRTTPQQNQSRITPTTKP